MTYAKHNSRSSIGMFCVSGMGLAVALWAAGCAAPKPRAAAPAAAAQPLTLFLMGDSTMSDKPVIPAYPERGWGQMLPMYFKPEVHIANHAVNGRSSKSFLEEGRWKTVLAQIKPGDYVIIQFGHNDENKNNPARFTEAFGEFKTNLTRYVREARGGKAAPVLATPVARRKFRADGKARDTHRVATRKAQRARLAERSKCSNGTQRVTNPDPERLATTGSEFCVVVRDGGTKRKQRASKPCD